jgi:TonB family protein
MFLRPLGTDLDRFALQIVGLDRFTPGTHDGAPVAVALSVEVGMQSCLAEAQDDAGKKSSSLQLRSQPMQKFEPLPQSPEDAVLSSGKSPWQDSAGVPHSERVSGSVSAPVPLFTTEAVYTIEARSARISGKCLVTLIVDRQGMPKSIRMLKTLDPGLDQNAMDAVGRYRFKPAMRNGEPVPVMITVEVNFQLY